MKIILLIAFLVCVIYLTPNKQKEPLTLGYHEAPQWMKDEKQNNRVSLVRIQASQGVRKQN